MHILQVVHGFPPNEWAGTELVTLQLSQALRARGHNVTVLTRVHDAQSAEGTLHTTSYNNLPVRQLVNNYTAVSTFLLSYDNPLFNQPFLRLLDQVKPDVVHFQHAQHLSVSLLRLAAALGYPTVLSLHDFFFACHRIQLINDQQQLCPGPDRGERCVPCLQAVAGADDVRRRFCDMQRALHAPDVILTPSAFLAQKMQSYFPFLKDKLRAVPLGVNPPAGEYHRRPPQSPGTPLRLLYVGVLAPHKGAHVLLEALKGLPADAIELSLYGMEWSQWQTYLDQLHAAADGLPVKFCGSYPHEQLGLILKHHDVLVMPMIWEETFSILTREALLAGLPVIAARRGALVEVVGDGVNGLLFEPENANDLRRCLLRLLTEPNLLEQLRMAETAVKTVTEYAGEIESIYQEVKEQRKRMGVLPPRYEEKPQQLYARQDSMAHDQRDLDEQTKEVTLQKTVTQEKQDVAWQETVTATSQSFPISVCIPTYNGASFLAQAIESIVAQSFPDFELLIVDDQSSDATVDIARSFADPRIRIHQNDARLGIPGNWNRCLALAQGEYICIFHQDDLMHPENLARKVQLLRSDPTIAMVHSAANFVVEDGAPSAIANWIESADTDFVTDGKMYFRKLLFYGNCICAPTVIVRRRLLLNLGGFEQTLGFTPDYLMWMRLCLEGRIAFLAQPLVRYRWHEGNASHVYRFEQGISEVVAAGERALQCYILRTGQQREGELLREAWRALAKQRWEIVKLDRGKNWYAQQSDNWQKIAAQQEATIKEQKEWAEQLEQGKAWLSEQRTNWQNIAEQREQQIQELRAWITHLEHDNARLREELHKRRTLNAHMMHTLKNLPGRVGRLYQTQMMSEHEHHAPPEQQRQVPPQTQQSQKNDD